MSEETIREMARERGMLNIEIDHRHIEIIQAAYIIGKMDGAAKTAEKIDELSREHHATS